MSNIGQKLAKLMRGKLGTTLVCTTLALGPTVAGTFFSDIALDELSTTETKASQALAGALLENIEDVTKTTGKISMLNNQVTASITAGDPVAVGKYTVLRDSALSKRNNMATDIAVSTLNSQHLTEVDYGKISDQFSDISSYSNVNLSDNIRSFDEMRSELKTEDGYAEMSRIEKAEMVGEAMEDQEVIDALSFSLFLIVLGVAGYRSGWLLGEELIGDDTIRDSIADNIDRISKPKPKQRIN